MLGDMLEPRWGGESMENHDCTQVNQYWWDNSRLCACMRLSGVCLEDAAGGIP